MPTPNKYHSSGKLYTLIGRRAASATSYIVEGYTAPNGGKTFQEAMIRPYNRGIKKANRLAEAFGHKFNKQAYLASLQG